MTGSAKAKGDAAERELADLLNAYADNDPDNRWNVRRALGAGRQDDQGDLVGVPRCIVQVRNYADEQRAERTALADAMEQLANASLLDFDYAVAAVRHRGGRWVISMHPTTFVRMLQAATNGQSA
jgi:hypothetical protein